ncbi:hypothetical protein E2C01_057239 [Portunus trituberculatus]|uniref:Uncharacterized protein n=1 Tax=Portunus trituberculatus TaxID=210409 RepID=A0A5B7GZY7_PORTR|nr:hypothetical protein [Portunus trituberculatus]
MKAGKGRGRGGRAHSRDNDDKSQTKTRDMLDRRGFPILRERSAYVQRGARGEDLLDAESFDKAVLLAEEVTGVKGGGRQGRQVRRPGRSTTCHHRSSGETARWWWWWWRPWLGLVVVVAVVVVAFFLVLPGVWRSSCAKHSPRASVVLLPHPTLTNMSTIRLTSANTSPATATTTHHHKRISNYQLNPAKCRCPPEDRHLATALHHRRLLLLLNTPPTCRSLQKPVSGDVGGVAERAARGGTYVAWDSPSLRQISPPNIGRQLFGNIATT